MKKQFLLRPEIKNLSKEEQDKKWKTYLNNRKSSNAAPKKQPRQPQKAKKLNDCSLHYALALSDPWDCPEPPCVPDNITIESYKFNVRARGTFGIGTNGTGFVAINPYCPYEQSAPNAIFGYSTTIAYAGINIYNPALPGVANINTNSSFPYTNSDSYEQAYRVVGAGIKVCYAGNEMNRQGQYTIYRDPSNGAIAFGSSLDNLLTMRESSLAPVDKEWHCALWKPVSASDITYASRGIDIDSGTGSKLFAMNPSIIVGVTGGSAGASVSYDVIVWFEMTGRNMPVVSVSHTDPIGYSMASAAVSSHQPESSPKQNAITFANKMEEHGKTFSFIDTLGSVAKYVVPIVSEIAPLFF